VVGEEYEDGESQAKMTGCKEWLGRDGSEELRKWEKRDNVRSLAQHDKI